MDKCTHTKASMRARRVWCGEDLTLGVCPRHGEVCDASEGNAVAFACGTLANLASSPAGIRETARFGALQACFPLMRCQRPSP